MYSCIDIDEDHRCETKVRRATHRDHNVRGSRTEGILLHPLAQALGRRRE
jgi:hypothetical protein